MTNIQRGAVLRTANAWDGLRSGTITATATAQPLSADHLPIMEVIVQNDPDGQTAVFVGDRRYQYYQLNGGASVTVPVCDLSLVYVRTAAGTATVNWLAGE
jgi:hypothetical protein